MRRAALTLGNFLNRRSTEDGEKFTFEQFAVYLTPTNAQANQVNEFF